MSSREWYEIHRLALASLFREWATLTGSQRGAPR
jgi:hypothetical protein